MHGRQWNGSMSEAFQLSFFHQPILVYLKNCSPLLATAKVIIYASRSLSSNSLKHNCLGNVQQRYSLTIPRQGTNLNFAGTGDLFAALFLAHTSLSPNIKVAFEYTVATLQSVIANTIQRTPEGKRRSEFNRNMIFVFIEIIT